MNIEPFIGALESSKSVITKNLLSFVDYVKAQLPYHSAEIGRRLMTYYLSCNEVLRQAVLGQGSLSVHAGRLARLHIYQIHDIISAFHSTEVLLRASSVTSRGYEIIYMDGVASMYERTPEYTEDWLEFFRRSAYGRCEHFGAGLYHRQYKEIAAVLGLGLDLDATIFWAEVNQEVALVAQHTYDSWSDPRTWDGIPNSSA
jgi:hypothetical protein